MQLPSKPSKTRAKVGKRRAWFIFAPTFLLLACSGAAPSDLFAGSLGTTSPTSASSGGAATGGSAPSSAHDAGSVDASAPVSSPPPETPSDDAGPVAPPQLPVADAAPAPGDADAGATEAVCPLAGEAATMIDDGSWPGPNASILPQCGRTGSWYVFNDGASKQSPSEAGAFGPFLTASPPNQVTGYVRTFGTLSEARTGTTAAPHWGAGIGFDLDDAGNATLPYDLKSSAYQGFSFWVRTGTTNQVASIVFAVPTAQTASYVSGAYHETTFAAPAAGVWTKVTVPFSTLLQPSWTVAAERVAFDTSAVETLQWNFDPGAAQALGFDVSIGDVELW
jgi:hypothetical protein